MSGTLKITVALDVSGPLAAGGAQRMVGQWLEDTTQALAAAGAEMLRAFPMNKSGRAAGAFQQNLRTVRRSPGEVDVPGPMIRGVTWAPWLEGVSRRNQSTSFRGYHLFRKTRAALQQRAPAVAQARLDALMPAVGGP